MSAPSESGRDRRHVQTAADVRRLLAAEIESLVANADLDPIARARILARLTEVTLHAIDRESLEARLEAIESTLKIRSMQTKEST